MNILIKKNDVNISIKEEIKKTIIVTSHERSGTHFLMNSLSCNTNYTVDPYLNFDHKPLGDMVNFFNKNEVSNFIKKISLIRKDQKNFGLASIIKSHHLPSHFTDLFDDEHCIFINIYRDPYDTLLSFWKFIRKWVHHEGPITDSLFEFIQSKPEGQMLRYQIKSYDTIFERWANHVNDWQEYSKKKNNVYLVNYKDLDKNFTLTLKNLLSKINIPFQKIIEPDRHQYFKGTDIKLSNEDKNESQNYIYKMIKNHHNLSLNLFT